MKLEDLDNQSNERNEAVFLFGQAVITMGNYLSNRGWFEQGNRLYGRRDKTILNKGLQEAFAIQSCADFGETINNQKHSLYF